MIMKKIAVLLFFAISNLACTTDDVEMNTEVKSLDFNTDSAPPTNDKDWEKTKSGIQLN